MHFFELVGKYSQQQQQQQKEYDERARTFTTFSLCTHTHIHLLTDWTNSFLNDGELSIIYLLCWADEFIAVCAFFLHSRNRAITTVVSPTPSLCAPKWILQQLASSLTGYSFRLSLGVHIENHSKCNLSSPSECSAHMHSGLLFTFYLCPCVHVFLCSLVCSCNS